MSHGSLQTLQHLSFSEKLQKQWPSRMPLQTVLAHWMASSSPGNRSRTVFEISCDEIRRCVALSDRWGRDLSRFAFTDLRSRVRHVEEGVKQGAHPPHCGRRRCFFCRWVLHRLDSGQCGFMLGRKPSACVSGVVAVLSGSQ